MSYTRVIVYPYRMGSQSARHLATALDARRVRPNGHYRFRKNHMVINWGNTRIPDWFTVDAATAILNKPQYVENASDKIKTFQLLEAAGVHIPEFTRSKEAAQEMLAKPKFKKFVNMVVCRQLTRANGGRGIVLAKTPEELVDAPLYTRYIPKSEEYRIHASVQFGVFDVQQKRRPEGQEVAPYIRNHDQGWVFCRENVSPPDAVKLEAEKAVQAMRLDFGAVDIGYHPEIGVTVYEVNTAPGLEGATLNSYNEIFRRCFMQNSA